MTAISIRIFLPVVLLSSLTSGIGFSGAKKANRASALSVSTRILQANRILININDRGSLSDSIGEGAWRIDPWKWGSMQSIVCDQGPWIIGKLNGTLSADIAYWGTSYMPGPVIGGKPALNVRPQDSLRYHPYKLNVQSNSSDPDFATWPADLGAPIDPSGKPLLFGDELVWSVFNGADSTAYPNLGWNYGGFPHLPIEIHQAVYAEIVPIPVGYSEGDAYSGEFLYAAFISVTPAFLAASASRAVLKTDIDL